MELWSNRQPRNRLLAALPAHAYAVLAPHLTLVRLELKQVLFDVDRPIEYVYFPEAGIASVLGVMSDGSAVETATIGNEGMVGLPVFLGTDQTSSQAFCQIPGAALRMASDDFRHLIAAVPSLTMILHRYTQALFTLVAQSSACNRMHSTAERCARWLLHCHDRIGAAEGRDSFPLTHQFLSQMLGVRRATVTEAMRDMQAAGAVTYVRGQVVVRDRAALERAACECYGLIVREFDRLLDGQTRRSVLEDTRVSENGRSTLGDGAPRAAPSVRRNDAHSDD